MVFHRALVVAAVNGPWQRSTAEMAKQALRPLLLSPARQSPSRSLHLVQAVTRLLGIGALLGRSPGKTEIMSFDPKPVPALTTPSATRPARVRNRSRS
jgi:hypothetical protein